MQTRQLLPTFAQNFHFLTKREAIVFIIFLIDCFQLFFSTFFCFYKKKLPKKFKKKTLIKNKKEFESTNFLQQKVVQHKKKKTARIFQF